MREVASGSLIHGHQLLEKIEEGHYGQVWRARYLDQPVALKIFAGERRAANLRHEAFAQYALGRLPAGEARFFPRVEHIDLEADPPYLRMELIDGTPFEELLASGTLSLEERLEVAERILEGLAVVHRHDFVHGDLSPSNVLVTEDQQVRLIDVGYGALFEAPPADIRLSTTREDRPEGVASPLYAAPERFRSRTVGKPADVFSFGKLLYRAITGEQPFVIKPVSLKFPALGAAWDGFVFRCLEEQPEARFADAAEALAEYPRIHRPTPAAGDHRAECPECGAARSIPGGWVGERFPCRGCGRTIEVLFYDEAARYAITALSEEPGPAPAEPIAFPESRVVARQAAEERILRTEAPEPRSFATAALITLLAYGLFWVPGVVLNGYFLSKARAARRETGRRPFGMTALELMMWILVYLPLLGLGVLLISGIALTFILA